MSALLFGGRSLPCSDPCFICRIVIDEETWYSVEHYFQGSKFADRIHRDDIMAQRPERIGPKLAAAQHGRLVRGMGASKSYERVPNFRPLQILYVATRVKFEQNMDLRRQLVEAGGAVTEPENNVEEGEASKLYAKVVARVRDEVRPKQEHDQPRLAESRREFQAGGAVAQCDTKVEEGEASKWYAKVIERVREELRPEQERDQARLSELRREFQEQENFDENEAAERIAAARASFGAHLRTILVRKLDGSATELYLHPNDNIEEVREQLGFQLGYRPNRLLLFRDCNELEHQQTIGELDLQDTDEISMVIKSPIPNAHTFFSEELQASIRAACAVLPRAE
mmetsp:Transcript_61435/g.129623  ORF Transcript_61435/g.129623 Transcript_61435/m.129623 type:complete len:341 (-) Transcript_61435:92-1114(-)